MIEGENNDNQINFNNQLNFGNSNDNDPNFRFKQFRNEESNINMKNFEAPVITHPKINNQVLFDPTTPHSDNISFNFKRNFDIEEHLLSEFENELHNALSKNSKILISTSNVAVIPNNKNE